MKQNLANSIILPPKNGGLKAWSHSVRKANLVYFLLLDVGKQYVTAIPVASSSVQNQHEAIQPGTSYQQNVVGAYVQV